MNKNLKKVISAVAAIAMTASSFIALAADYPDVDTSASYKQAVDELSALNVINGYEDGTFQPDKLVTRAEFSKMVITALGSSELAQAEAAMGRDTAFTDVTGSHWAAGYVTAAVAQSIINGMGDGTFAPDANVTYAQAMKMLVCAAGYEQWSMDKGGWPDGYMYWGNQLKVGNGVKDVTDNTEITRAQVAQMIDNIINAPICVDTHKYSYDQYGNRYPDLEQKDGTGLGFESILTRNHDAYKVKGVVMETSRSGGAIKADEIVFEMQNAKRWLDNNYAITKALDSTLRTIKAKIGTTDVADYLQQYVEILVQDNDDDEYVVLSVASAGQTEEIVVPAKDYDKDASKADRIYFYSNGKKSSYKINSNETTLYVNGVSIDTTSDAAAMTLLQALEKYVDNNSASDVTLIDVPDGGSTDGTFDLILVDVYDTAIVDSVSKADSTTPTINFSSASVSTTRLGFDTTDQDITVVITKDGEEISAADLNEYDVLSIKRDITKNFKDSSFYEIYVSSATEDGKVSSYDDEEGEYVINGTTYNIVDGLVSGNDLELSNTYTLYLDVFGRIAYIDELSSAKKIGILNAVYTARGSDIMVTIVDKDGTTTDYTLRNATTDANDPVTLAAKAILYEANTETKKAPQDRVVEYSINTKEELTIKDVLTYSTANGEYRASNDKIDGYKISADATAMLNTADPTDIQPMAYANLVDEREYVAYLFDRSNDSTYRFVLIANGSGAYSKDTQLAVYKKSVSTQNDNEEPATAIVVLSDGEEKSIFLDTAYNAPALVAGDAIIYSTNNANEIDDIKKVTNLTFSEYGDVRDAFLNSTYEMKVPADIMAKLVSDGDATSFVFGPVIDKSNSSITLAQLEADGKTSASIGKDYSYANDVKIYVLDLDSGMKLVDSIDTGMTSSPSKLSLSSKAYVAGSSNKYFNWTYGPEGEEVTLAPDFALLRIFDKDVQEVYIVKPDTDKF